MRSSISLVSSDAIVVSLQNTKNYYVSAQLGVAAPAELLFSGGKQIQFLLRPFEERTVYIPVTIAPGLSSRYSYQFPIEVTNYYRTLANSTLFVNPSNPTYSGSDVSSMIQNLQTVAQSKVSANVQIQCAAQGTPMVNLSFRFTCDINNQATTPVQDLTVCVNNNCSERKLDAQQTTSFDYNLSFSNVGIMQVPVRLQIGTRVQETLVDVTILDSPALSLSTLDAPAKLTYDQEGNVRLLLSKDSYTAPVQTVVRIFDSVPYIWNIGTLNANKELTVTVSGSSLQPGMNFIPITATYYDAQGKQYTYKTNVQIELVNVSLWQRVMIWLRDLLG